MESGPIIPIVVFSEKAVPHLHMNGYVYYTPTYPNLSSRLWHCFENKDKKCKEQIHTSITLYNLEVLHYNCNDSKPHGHPRGGTPSYITSCNWILYKYNFSELHLHQSMADGMIWKGEVSNVHDMLTLLLMNKIEDDPTALGRCIYCFFQSHMSTDWQDGSHNQSGGQFKLEFRKLWLVTQENLHDYWRALLTCIMQGTFGSYTEHINGAKVHFSGNDKPPFISVWTSVDFTPSKPRSPPPKLGQMLTKLFEPLYDVTFFKHGTNEFYF